MNSLLTLQSFRLVYEGSQLVNSTTASAMENSIADYSYCARFTLTGTAIDRITLEVDRDGIGADLIVQIRSGMNPGSGVDGTLLKQVIVPKEFIPTVKTYWSVPVSLTGLTSGGQYWLMVQRKGDATNKLDWLGHTATSASYPAWQRSGPSGAWTTRNQLHFTVCAGASGDLMHSIYANTGYTTIEYSGESISKVYRYLPPEDTSDGGIRDILTFTWSDEYLTGGVLS